MAFSSCVRVGEYLALQFLNALLEFLDAHGQLFILSFEMVDVGIGGSTQVFLNKAT